MKRNKRYAYGGGIYGADEGAGANPQQSMTPPAATPPATPPAATLPVASPAAPSSVMNSAASPSVRNSAASSDFTNRLGQMMADRRAKMANKQAERAASRGTMRDALFGSGPAPSTGAVFRKGGNVKAYAKGGKVSSASSRGDGIASKGKTRGKMC